MVETMRRGYSPLRFMVLAVACALLCVALLLMLADEPAPDPGRVTPQTVAPAVVFGGEP